MSRLRRLCSSKTWLKELNQNLLSETDHYLHPQQHVLQECTLRHAPMYLSRETRILQLKRLKAASGQDSAHTWFAE